MAEMSQTSPLTPQKVLRFSNRTRTDNGLASYAIGVVLTLVGWYSHVQDGRWPTFWFCTGTGVLVTAAILATAVPWTLLMTPLERTYTYARGYRFTQKRREGSFDQFSNLKLEKIGNGILGIVVYFNTGDKPVTLESHTNYDRAMTRAGQLAEIVGLPLELG